MASIFELQVPAMRRGAPYGGAGSLQGAGAAIVTRDGSPAEVLVRVHARSTGAPVTALLSEPDGTWEALDLDPDTEFYVIAFDPLREYNAVIADMIRPEPYA